MTLSVILLNNTVDSVVPHVQQYSTFLILAALCKSVVLLLIMSAAVLGNSLVIVGVVKFHKLRSVANSFLVSLALADLLVALFVMPFSATQEITGRWMFADVFCDVFNANDVLFSTASLLHLCCISVDRYVYITNPFHYAEVMSRRRSALMITFVWVSASTLSHIPIFFGWHTVVSEDEDRPFEYLQAVEDGICSFRVNRVYGLLSSAVSFWLPACVMLATYVRLYREATKQADLISKCSPSVCQYKANEEHCATKKAPSLKSYPTKKSPSLEPYPTKKTPSSEPYPVKKNQSEFLFVRKCLTNKNSSSGDRSTKTIPSSQHCITANKNPSSEHCQERNKMAVGNSIVVDFRPTKRAHKAAQTLGMIVGAFLVCWLPFFTWYLATTMCSDACYTPPVIASILFWIGYLNSAINPVIYAFFNRDFREAFGRLLGCLCRRQGGSASNSETIFLRSDVNECHVIGRGTML